MKPLTVKQKEIISKYNITVSKSDDGNSYFYFIAGVYNQQKGCSTELQAYYEGIAKAISRN